MPEDTDGPHGLDIVYVADFYGDALFAESADAKLAADKCRAVANSAPWGEFRQAWPDSDFEWLEGRLESNPPDDAEFSRSDVPPVGEGFPEDPWLPDVVVDWFPEDLIEKYGGKVGFTDGGYHLTLPGQTAHLTSPPNCASEATSSRSQSTTSRNGFPTTTGKSIPGWSSPGGTTGEFTGVRAGSDSGGTTSTTRTPTSAFQRNRSMGGGRSTTSASRCLRSSTLRLVIRAVAIPPSRDIRRPCSSTEYVSGEPRPGPAR